MKFDSTARRSKNIEDRRNDPLPRGIGLLDLNSFPGIAPTKTGWDDALPEDTEFNRRFEENVREHEAKYGVDAKYIPTEKEQQDALAEWLARYKGSNEIDSTQEAIDKLRIEQNRSPAKEMLANTLYDIISAIDELMKK